jgi:hypothetical protein
VIGKLLKVFLMENINSESRCKKKGLMLSSPDINHGVSELDILRKAYELILENSDLFYAELGKAFTEGRDANNYRPRI